MALVVEKEIQKLLQSKKTPLVIAKKLLKKLKIDNTPEAFLAVCQFMYQSGLYDLLIKTTIDRLKNREVIQWGLIIEILESNKIKIPKEKRAFFIKGIMEQNQIALMLTSHKWDKYFPKLVSMKSKQVTQIRKKNNPYASKLKEDLKFIRAQGILKKEGEILKELKKIDPENPELHDEWLKFREKWGRQIILNKKTSMLNKSIISAAPSSEKEKKQAEQIAHSIKTVLQDTPGKSYDMALLFSFIGYPHLAIHILKDHIHDISSQWLYLDLLLQSEFYVNCLSFVDMMEVQYSEDPETVFALTYIRAKAYYGLGRKKQAKDILSDLLKVRPNYRLTHHILKQWEKEVSEFE